MAGLSEEDEAEMRLFFSSLEAHMNDIDNWMKDLEACRSRSVS